MTTSVKVRPGWAALRGTLPVPGDVRGALAELGITVIRETGDELVAHCPQHEQRTGKADRHPSWSALADDRVKDDGSVVPAGTFGCFACGYRGSFVRLVTDVLDLDVDDARAWVRARGGIERARRVLERASNPAPTIGRLPVTEASLALFTDPPAAALRGRRLTAEAASALRGAVGPADRLLDPADPRPRGGHAMGMAREDRTVVPQPAQARAEVDDPVRLRVLHRVLRDPRGVTARRRAIAFRWYYWRAGVIWGGRQRRPTGAGPGRCGYRDRRP